jgi:uncharacterized protein (TIGR03118 family)
MRSQRLTPRRIACALAAIALPVATLPVSTFASDNNDDSWRHAPYEVHNLVSDGVVPADFIDPNLVNAWGVAFNQNGPVWVADNGSGVSTLYDGTGKAIPLVVAIPPAPSSGDTQGHPTGIVFSSSNDFAVTNGTATGPSRFIFVSEDGIISGWAPSVDVTHALIAVDNSASNAIYKGLALAGNGATHLLYATDFHNRRVDVFNATFQPVVVPGAFEDRFTPRSYAPFGIQNINGDIYVTYAKQDADAVDDVHGPGLGFVDVFDAGGKLIKRFAARGVLNAPWGIALAPASFGPFGGALLVGNFGDGTINVFGPRSGRFEGTLRDDRGHRIRIDGLWGLQFGNGVAAQPLNSLFFAAGPGDEEHGVYGVINATQR